MCEYWMEVFNFHACGPLSRGTQSLAAKDSRESDAMRKIHKSMHGVDLVSAVYYIHNIPGNQAIHSRYAARL